MKFAIEEDIFLSSLDTTFAYYPNRLVPFHYRPAIRLGGDYRAIHYPWYERLENYDEEARNYHQRANPNISSGKDGKHVTWVIRLKKFSWTLIFFFCKYSIKSRFLGTLSVKLLSFRGTIPRKKTL
jgi:hypothetical protein